MNIIGNNDTELKSENQKVQRKRLRLKKRFQKTKAGSLEPESDQNNAKIKAIHHSTDDSENEGIF